jgi:hypothetical protein
MQDIPNMKSHQSIAVLHAMPGVQKTCRAALTLPASAAANSGHRRHADRRKSGAHTRHAGLMFASGKKWCMRDTSKGDSARARVCVCVCV